MWLCFEEAFIYAFMCYLFIYFKGPTKQEKNVAKKANTYIAAVFDHRTI